MSRLPLKQTLLSVVLPVYNEAQVLEELCARIAAAIEPTGANYEILFVNDGSCDETPRVLDRLAEQLPQVRVLHFSRNFGHQAAVQAGLAHARGDAVVLMDSDLQDSPEAIPRFLAEWQLGSEVVYALRAERQESWWKRGLFHTFHSLLASISSTPIPAHAGNFSLMDRRVVREIVTLGERDRYLPGLRAWVGYRQTGIEVRRAARYDSEPRVSLRGLVRLAKTAIFSFSAVPLALFYVIGCTALSLFVGLSGFALFCKLFTSLAIPGWTSEVLVASFFGAVNALGISVLGEYVLRIYDQVRGRPMYLVARTANVNGPLDTVEESPEIALLREARHLVRESSTWSGGERRKRAAQAGGAKQVGKGGRKTGRSKAK